MRNLLFGINGSVRFKDLASLMGAELNSNYARVFYIVLPKTFFIDFFIGNKIFFIIAMSPKVSHLELIISKRCSFG